MSLFRLGERRDSLENPSTPLSTASVMDLWGAGGTTDSGVSISETSALNIITVLRGVALISGAVAGLPLKAFTYGERREVTHPALGNQPVPAQAGTTAFERWETVMAHMLLWGNAYLLKTYDSAGRVIDLHPVLPSRVTVGVERTNSGPVKVFAVDGGEQVFTDYDVMHVPWMSLDGITGIGPVAKARQALGIYTAAEKTAARLFGNGNLLSGVLRTTQQLTQPQAEALKAQWRQKMQGLGNSHDVAVLDSGAEFTPITMPPADAQFLESRKFQKSEIATWLGLPGWMLNDQEKSTSWGTGMEQQFQTWAMLTLKPHLQRIEQRLTREVLPQSLYAEFIIEGLLRGDSAGRAAFYSSGITNGWLVPNEARARENLQPVPWGDEPYLPHNTPASSDPSASSSDGTPAPTDAASEKTARQDSIAATIQKIYLGVGKVITVDEARRLARAAGADLDESVTAADVFADVPPLPATAPAPTDTQASTGGTDA